MRVQTFGWSPRVASRRQVQNCLRSVVVVVVGSGTVDGRRLSLPFVPVVPSLVLPRAFRSVYVALVPLVDLLGRVALLALLKVVPQ